MKRITESDMIATYLSDESRQTGTTDCVFLPESEEDVIYILKKSSGKHITTQGARTGLTAGCVPQGGITISMELMDKVLDIDLKCDKPYITVQPGVVLQNLRYNLAFQGFFFLPILLKLPPRSEEWLHVTLQVQEATVTDQYAITFLNSM